MPAAKSKIADDYPYTIHLPDGKSLKAGDEIPADVELGDHVTRAGAKPADDDSK